MVAVGTGAVKSASWTRVKDRDHGGTTYRSREFRPGRRLTE